MLYAVYCIENGYQCVIGDQSSYEREGVISAPIHMDTVACYGTEDKLTDCTYHTDTSEDMHNEDIWINCNPTQQPTSVTNNDQSNPTQQPSSVTNNEQSIDDTETTSKELKSDEPIALAVSLVGLAISLVVIGLLICLLVYMYKRKRKSETTNHRWAGMVCCILYN